MHASKKSRQRLRAELKRIRILQCQWNALSVAERAWIARASPDLSLFFRRQVGNEVPGAAAQIIDLFEVKGRGIAEVHTKAKTRIAALRIVERGIVKRVPRT
jgi:hypothetical protein